MITVRVPASTSNLGAGFDCVGLALDLWLEAAVKPGDAPPEYHGTIAEIDPARDVIGRILRERGALADRRLVVRSAIPIGKGLGSSAAAVVAALALVQLLDGTPIDRDRLFDEAVDIEGHPDNAGPAVFGGLVLDAARPTKLVVHPSVGVALALPDAGVSTERARALLPDEVARRIAVDQAARAAALVLGLTTGDVALLRHGLEDRLAEPRRRSLIPGYDAAREAGRSAGAYGVTISGSGSGIVALAAREEAARVAERMAQALSAAGNPARALTPAVATDGLQLPSATASS